MCFVRLKLSSVFVFYFQRKIILKFINRLVVTKFRVPQHLNVSKKKILNYAVFFYPYWFIQLFKVNFEKNVEKFFYTKSVVSAWIFIKTIKPRAFKMASHHSKNLRMVWRISVFYQYFNLNCNKIQWNKNWRNSYASKYSRSFSVFL